MSFAHIKYKNEIILNCYHGTDSDSAQRVEKNGRFAPTRGDSNFLGDGVYFFKGDFNQAKLHAIYVAKSRKLAFFVVFNASVHLGACLDLCNAEHRENLIHLRGIFSRVLSSHIINDQTLINFYAMNVQQIDTVLCEYSCKWPFGSDSRSSCKSGVMICIRNLAAIRKFMIYYRGKVIQCAHLNDPLYVVRK